MIYGYARVSTDGQSVDAQVKQLRAAGCEKVFRETASGARSTHFVLFEHQCNLVLIECSPSAAGSSLMNRDVKRAQAVSELQRTPAITISVVRLPERRRQEMMVMAAVRRLDALQLVR
jgi:hypothetical protein